MTKIFVVDNSPFIRKAIVRIFADCPNMEVVGTAASGEEALERIPVTCPDVVTLDVAMPGMGGLATLRELIRRQPGISVIMLSAHTRDGAEITMDALNAGALDFIDKSRLNVMDFEHLARELLGKIETWKGTRGRRDASATPALPASGRSSLREIDWSRYELCVVGASTGGPPALQRMVAAIPKDFPVPMAIVQHMPPGFTRPFAERLNGLGGVCVREAVDHNQLQAGTVLLARAGAHLRIEADLSAHMTLDPVDAAYIPSVDVLMESASRARPGRVVGILLTGMGEDGAQGMLAIRTSGGLTLGQDEASCVVYGMPRAALRKGAVEHELSLDEICQIFGQRRGSA